MNELEENTAATSGLYLKIEELLGIDMRALATFRVMIASLILVDLVNRSFDLVAHYTDAGVVPRALVVEHAEQPWLLSFHMLDGGLALQIVLFIATAIAAMALLIGFRSRISCFVCWLLMLSLHVRNPFVNNLGDWLLVDLLFWGIFLPLGARYAWDGLQKPAGQLLPPRAVSLATLGILLQIGLLYVLAGHHKISPVWHTDGTAVEFALKLDRIVAPAGQYLLLLPESVLRLITFATLYLEKWGPFLLLVPFFTRQIRTGVALTFMLFHAGLAVSFELGVFPFICIAAWVLVLPSGFWDSVRIDQLKRVGERMLDTIRSQVRQIARPINVMPGISETLIAIMALFGTVSSAMLYAGMMDEQFYDTLYQPVEPVVNTINLRQRWDMFSPEPPRRDGWFIVAGYGDGGAAVNLLASQEPLVWGRPSQVSDTYRNQRWRKYMEWVMNKPAIHGAYMAAYFERMAQLEGMADVAVFFMQERTRDDGSSTLVRRQQLQ